MPASTTTVSNRPSSASTATAKKTGKRSSSNSKRRTVSFAPNAQLRLYRWKMTETERNNYYYNDDDYEEFKQEARQTIDMIAKNQEIDEVHHCARGVICRTPDALRRRVALRVKAWDAVFSEQERQWGKEEEDAQLDAEALAAAYTKQCYSSKRLAYTIAKCDEKTVAAFYSNNSSSVVAKRRAMNRPSTSNRTIVILNSMSSGVRSSRQLATTAA
jgi:hypothetical protein